MIFQNCPKFHSPTAREILFNNFEISLVVFMPNITTNHAITYTNEEIVFHGVDFSWTHRESDSCPSVRVHLDADWPFVLWQERDACGACRHFENFENVVILLLLTIITMD